MLTRWQARAAHEAHFDALYAEDPDPWRYRTAWTEEAKRRRIAGALGPRRARGLELGSGNGESTAALARSFAHLLALDGAERAAALTRRRVAALSQVTARAARLPEDYPEGVFDGIVASEVLYYLPQADLIRLLARIRDSLTPTGLLVVAASIRPFDDREMMNGRLFAILRETMGRPVREDAGASWRLATYRRG